MIDFERAKAAFEEYLKDYDREDDKIRLKIVHTYYVVDCVENIARRMGLSVEERKLGMLIGLLHDIGRFEQIKRYDSFMPDTMDHAAYGAALLFGKKKEIRRFIKDDRWDAVIETAIAKHSDFRLEGVEGEQALLHARLIRDADKLDNCRVKLEESLETLLGIPSHEPLEGKISPAVWEACMQEKSVLSSDRRTKADYWISYIAQIYDVNFPATFSIILEEDYVLKILRRLQYEDKDTRSKMELLSARLQDYMKRKTAGV
ncbi:MAG TPA: HD domain-containing protein [Candidatus Blautia faecavium]|uniref:HD domain-containing protein n=1 Tax=Candidatus Blautia faecavium TaxID=2838487 RepID=A0A9D2RW31_9FIRM|nr:HD domain-containing protein [Candidatus Blautia faecavium]